MSMILEKLGELGLREMQWWQVKSHISPEYILDHIANFYPDFERREIIYPIFVGSHIRSTDILNAFTWSLSYAEIHPVPNGNGSTVRKIFHEKKDRFTLTMPQGEVLTGDKVEPFLPVGIVLHETYWKKKKQQRRDELYAILPGALSNIFALHVTQDTPLLYGDFFAGLSLFFERSSYVKTHTRHPKFRPDYIHVALERLENEHGISFDPPEDAQQDFEKEIVLDRIAYVLHYKPVQVKNQEEKLYTDFLIWPDVAQTTAL